MYEKAGVRETGTQPSSHQYNNIDELCSKGFQEVPTGGASKCIRWVGGRRLVSEHVIYTAVITVHTSLVYRNTGTN